MACRTEGLYNRGSAVYAFEAKTLCGSEQWFRAPRSHIESCVHYHVALRFQQPSHIYQRWADLIFRNPNPVLDLTIKSKSKSKSVILHFSNPYPIQIRGQKKPKKSYGPETQAQCHLQFIRLQNCNRKRHKKEGTKTLTEEMHSDCVTFERAIRLVRHFHVF